MIVLQIFYWCSVFQRAKALKQKKEEGNEAFKAGRLSEAYDLYTVALKIDLNNKSTNAKLFFNRATVCSKVVFDVLKLMIKVIFYTESCNILFIVFSWVALMKQ
jgi:hypothetical protein